MKRLLLRTAVGAGLILAVFGGTAAGGLRVNTTPSVPLGLWRVESGGGLPKRGSVASFCLPEPVAAEGLARGMLRPGWCPGGAQSVLKTVAALPGDTVSIGPGGIAVNGRWAGPAGHAAEFGPQPHGERAVARGEVWLLGWHPLGWDSRYFGPVPLSGFNGSARPVFTSKGG